MEGQKKRTLSGAERQAKYVKENKKKSDLTQAKRQFERSKLLQADTDEAKAMREAAKVRKQCWGKHQDSSRRCSSKHPWKS